MAYELASQFNPSKAVENNSEVELNLFGKEKCL